MNIKSKRNNKFFNFIYVICKAKKKLIKNKKKGRESIVS